ncbi:MAG TPA: ABC transporter permease [Fimbriimonadales bacterium]|nr:ABC transporter permease [Fimbriimonadales bacterium]
MIRSVVFWGSAIYLILLLLFALFGTLRYDVTQTVGRPFEAPSEKFWLGTDELGRDVFSRLAYGARVSLGIGVSVELCAIIIALLIGTAAGYGARWFDNILMRFTDAMFAFPDILLAILIIGVIGASDVTQRIPLLGFLPDKVVAALPVFAALGVVAWPSLARLVRNQVLSLKEREFVLASRALGAGHAHIVFRHILPHLFGLISAVAMVEMAMIILAESSLSFLGIGIQPPYPSWGSMINESRAHLAAHPILLLWPCLTLSVTILALNFVGDGLRDRLDPRMIR